MFGAILVAVLPLLFLVLGSSYFDGLFTSPKPPGQTLFMLVRLSGLYSIYLLVIQIVLGLNKARNGAFFGYRWSAGEHIILGVICACSIAIHISLFIVAGAIRTETFSLAGLIPVFDQGYYKQRLGFGALSMWLLGITIFSGIVRLKYSVKSARWLHKSALLVFLLAMLHSLSIGSDTRSFIVISFYGVLVLIVSLSLMSYLRSQKKILK